MPSPRNAAVRWFAVAQGASLAVKVAALLAFLVVAGVVVGGR